MKTYFVGYAVDTEAHSVLGVVSERAKAAGGFANVSRSFGHGPAFIVLSLPDGVEPESVLPENSPKAVAVEDILSKVEPEPAQPEESQPTEAPQSQDFGGEFDD